MSVRIRIRFGLGYVGSYFRKNSKTQKIPENIRNLIQNLIRKHEKYRLEKGNEVKRRV